MAGDHQGGRVRPSRSDLGQQGEAVHPRHLDVGDDGVVVQRGNPLERDGRGVGGVHRDPVHPEPECLGKRLQQCRVVVHDEYARLVHDSVLTGAEIRETSSIVAEATGR